MSLFPTTGTSLTSLFPTTNTYTVTKDVATCARWGDQIPTAHPTGGTVLLVDGEAVYTCIYIYIHAYITTAATIVTATAAAAAAAAATAKTSSHEKCFFVFFCVEKCSFAL